MDQDHEASSESTQRTHEKVVCLRAESAHLEQFHQVEELPMYVTANLHWDAYIHTMRNGQPNRLSGNAKDDATHRNGCINHLHVCLLYEDLASFDA